MTPNEDLEQLLGRSLEDDQESRRLLLARAGAPEHGLYRDAASRYGEDKEPSARIAMEKIIGMLSPFAPPEKAHAGPEFMQVVEEYMRSCEKPVEERTLRTHLASLPEAERRAVVSSFVEDARVSCAYEGIELSACGMIARIEEGIAVTPKPPTKE
jgi:hypothetical protein